MKLALPKIGMRNLKTAVAVMACFFIFLPFWVTTPITGAGLSGANIGPFYACITAVICMQTSVQETVHQGVSRVIGTLLGGGVGLLVLLLDDLFELPLLTGLMLGGGVVLTIWLCNLIRRPAACSIGCVVLCVVMLNHSGADRYLYTIIRMGETIVGIAVAVLVNHVLPDKRTSEDAEP